MKITENELYEKGVISQNVLYLYGKAYKIIGYDYLTKEYELQEVNRGA